MNSIYFLTFFIVLLSFGACKKQSKVSHENIETKDSIIRDDGLNKKALNVRLSATTRKAVAEWKDYQSIKEFIAQFQQISSSEALTNANELSELASYLKDSIKDKRFRSITLSTRLNIFNNECLRLKDMEKIPSITPHEVSSKVADILDAFDAVNAKLNSMFQIEDLENQLVLDPDFEKILLESSIDTVKPPRPVKKKKTKKHNKYSKKLKGQRNRKQQ